MSSTDRLTFTLAPHGIIHLVSSNADKWMVADINPKAFNLYNEALYPETIVSNQQLFPDLDAAFISHALQQDEYQLESIYLPGFDGYCRVSSIRQEDQCCLYIYPIPITTVEQPNTSIDLPEFFSNMVFESMPDYMFVKDKEFRIVLVNSNFLQLYPEEMRDTILGTTTLERYEPAEREAFLAMDRKALAEGFSATEETITFPNGQIRTLFTRKIRFIGPNDESYILGLASDITDAKEAKRLIEEQNEQLKEQAKEALTLTAQAKAADQAKVYFSQT